MEQWDILNVLRLKGCTEECATKIHHISPGEIAFFHSNLLLRSQQGQNEWLLEYLNSNCSRHTADPKFTYVICGRAVCRTVWLAVLGVSQARFYRMRALYLEGKVTTEPKRWTSNPMKPELRQQPAASSYLPKRSLH